MRVELLYFDGCPNLKVAVNRLADGLGALGRADIVVERRQVETPEQAEELQSLYSPTIRIEGTDPFATGEEQLGLFTTAPQAVGRSPGTRGKQRPCRLSRRTRDRAVGGHGDDPVPARVTVHVHVHLQAEGGEQAPDGVKGPRHRGLFGP